MKSTLKQKIVTWGLIGASSIVSLFNGGCFETTTDYKTVDGCYSIDGFDGVLYNSPNCDDKWYRLGASTDYAFGNDGRIYRMPNQGNSRSLNDDFLLRVGLMGVAGASAQ